MHVVLNDKLAKSYSEECTKKCSEAHKYIKNLIEKLNIGSITVEELHNLTSHISQVVKLFAVVTAEISASLDFSQVISQRNDEFKKFELHYRAIKILLEYCNDISEGIVDSYITF